jgi:transcriptional regulator with XRE-family HTH domain
MTGRADDELGGLIRRRRLAKGFSLEQLAALVGTSPSVIADYEAGRATPVPETLTALTAQLGLPQPASPGGRYEPRHAVQPAATGEEAILDHEPVWETLAVEGAVPALPPVVNPPHPASNGQKSDVPIPRPPADDEVAGGWQGPRPWAEPNRIVGEILDEEAIKPAGLPAVVPVIAVVPAAGAAPPGSEARPIPAERTPATEYDTRLTPTVSSKGGGEQAAPARLNSYLDLPGERRRYRTRAIITAFGVVALAYVVSWALGRADALLDAIIDTVKSIT